MQNLTSRLALNFICRRNSKILSFTSIVSILGISFGVSAFLVVITVLNSFQTEMKNIISSVNPNIIIYSPSGIPQVNSFIDNLKTKIEVPVTGISPFIYQESVMGLGRNSSAVYIRAIEGRKSSSAVDLERFIQPSNALQSLNDSSAYIDEFRNTLPVEDSSQLPHVILGYELAQNLDAKVGSTVTLMTFGAGENSLGVRYNKLYVTGIMRVGLSQYDKQYVLMNYVDGIKLFGAKGWASAVEVKLKNPDEALQVSENLEGIFPYSVVAWQQIDTSLFEQIERDGVAIKLIVLIISIVAGFNIIVTLSLTVMNRSKQIALLRSLGAKKIQVISVFVAAGVFLGLAGAILGVLVGLLLLKIFSGIQLGDFQKFYYLEKIPVQIDTTLIVIAFLTAILLAFLGALYPAWKASRVSPLYGLRQGN